MSNPIFHAEAVAHYENGAPDGDVLRYDQKWVRRSYAIAVLACIAGFLFISLFSVDEYATGSAVVRVDGRRPVNSLSTGNVETLEVKPGQWVEKDAVLVRMYNAEEMRQLELYKKEYDNQVGHYLQDLTDLAAKEMMNQARKNLDQVKVSTQHSLARAPVAGYVTDVRVRVGQHIVPGEMLLAVAPKDSAEVSIVAMVPADYRPMLQRGAKMRFELDGFHYEYSDLAVEDVAAEAVGTAEVMRYLGNERADSVAIDPGAKVLVTAKLPSSSFTSEGQAYGLTGNASIRVRRESLLVMLIPALRSVLP
jgi:multidrug efflux pump subunit AcrA (membrane-fusion protein)